MKKNRRGLFLLVLCVALMSCGNSRVDGKAKVINKSHSTKPKWKEENKSISIEKEKGEKQLYILVNLTSDKRVDQDKIKVEDYLDTLDSKVLELSLNVFSSTMQDLAIINTNLNSYKRKVCIGTVGQFKYSDVKLAEVYWEIFEIEPDKTFKYVYSIRFKVPYKKFTAVMLIEGIKQMESIADEDKADVIKILDSWKKK